MNQDKQPTRKAENYHELERSVALNFLKREAKKNKEHEPTNVLSKFLVGQVLLWIISYVKYRFWFKHRFLSYKDSAHNGIFPLYAASDKGKITIALAADWGTDTVESKEIGGKMAGHDPDYTIHLGDTYFVGDHKEIENNFARGNSFWPYGKVGSFALPGNHEMYSNGYGFFDTLLPWMGQRLPEVFAQKASYFCLQNEYWQVIGLDTGYRSVGIPLIELLVSNADLRPELVEWLQNEVKPASNNKGIILLSHHQYNSTFDKTYPAAAHQLKAIFGDREVLWFWGHEHRLALYGRYKDSDGLPAFGRCIGHGGMPVSLVDGTKKKHQNSNLVIYDNRPHKVVAKETVGHNGYAVLELEGRQATVRHYDETALLLTEVWTCDNNGLLTGQSIQLHSTDLEKFKEQDLDTAIGLPKKQVVVMAPQTS